MGLAQLECPLYGVHFSEKGNDLTNTLKIQRIPINLTLTLAKVTTKTVKRTKPRRRIACSGVRLCAETSEKPYFKRFSGIEKVHRNSIKITVDLWRSRRDSNPRAREGYTISNRARYDHFDTTPCSHLRKKCLIVVGLAATSIIIPAFFHSSSLF